MTVPHVDNPKISPLDWNRKPKRGCDEVLVRSSCAAATHPSQPAELTDSDTPTARVTVLSDWTCASLLHAFYANTRIVSHFV